VTKNYTLIYSLLFLCGSLLSFISSASAQTACMPVVYAFRHAEDSSEPAPEYPCFPGAKLPNGVPANCTTKLKPTGTEHANLYPEMIENFQAPEGLVDYCPVKYVFSVSPIKPVPDQYGLIGTNNPYYTARPLANDLTNAEPNIQIHPSICGDSSPPLYIDAGLTTVTPEFLRCELSYLTHFNGPASVAMFWTSEGLNALGQALVPGFNGIPVKGTNTPPRNAVYIFEAPTGSGFVPPKDGSPYQNSTQYVQCFNVKGTTIEPPSSSKYWCGNGNFQLRDSIKKEDLYKLHGRICDTALLSGKNTVAGYYGYCESPPSSQ
jgi:hypothetical protein